jgi:hypothetical protein
LTRCSPTVLHLQWNSTGRWIVTSASILLERRHGRNSHESIAARTLSNSLHLIIPSCTNTRATRILLPLMCSDSPNPKLPLAPHPSRASHAVQHHPSSCTYTCHDIILGVGTAPRLGPRAWSLRACRLQPRPPPSHKSAVTSQNSSRNSQRLGPHPHSLLVRITVSMLACHADRGRSGFDSPTGSACREVCLFSFSCGGGGERGARRGWRAERVEGGEGGGGMKLQGWEVWVEFSRGSELTQGLPSDCSSADSEEER